jgi:hypothetical protein
MRVALVLPVDSSRSTIAATRIVILLLRRADRVELNLMRTASDELASDRILPQRPVLLVGTDVDLPEGDLQARMAFEAGLRAQIARAYARQGIEPVVYDLQMI